MASDLEVLQGTWHIAALEVDGEMMPSDVFADAKVVIAGDRFTSLGMGADYEGTFAIDPSKKPKAFDLIITGGHAAGTRNPGVYRLARDGWTLCLATRGEKRPRTFTTKPGAGLALETFSRSGVARGAKRKSPPGRTKRASKRTTPESLAPATELEGEWKMMGAVFNGVPMPSQMVQWCRRETRGDVTTVIAGSNVMLQARFTLDQTQRPWAIDYENLAGTNTGELQAGIAELVDELLQICMAPPGASRPSNFESVKGDKRSYTTWIRIR